MRPGPGNVADFILCCLEHALLVYQRTVLKDVIMSKASNLKKFKILRLLVVYPCFFSLIALLLFSQSASAAQAVIGWNADSSPVTGYDVHYGTTSGNYTTTLNAGNSTSLTLQNLDAQSYYIAVSAYDSSNDQSPLSSELVIDSLTASAGSGGSISPSGSFFQTQGGSQSFTITPASGYAISDVKVDGVSVGAVSSYTFSSIAASHTISAAFSAQSSGSGTATSCTINATAGSGGTISPQGAVSVNSGANQTFTITPATGYSIANVQVDGSSVGAVGSYTFSNVTTNHTIAAVFAASQSQTGAYSITASAGSNGTISPAGAVSVAAGGNQTFSITPAAGYKVNSVLVDGTSIGAVTSYTFYTVSGNHTISASFISGTQAPIADAGPNQTVSDTGVSVTLSGANSTDVGGPGIYSYHWVQTGGPTVTLSPAYWVTSTFQAPTKPCALTFQLTVTDKNGVASTSQCIVNTSYWYTTAPTANAGRDQTVGEGAVTELNGTASAGPSADTSDKIVSYLWQQVDGPAVKLSNSASPTPTFTAPTSGNASLCFLLTVTDSLGLEANDFCFVNVDSTGLAGSAPTAVVGAEQSVNSGSTVTLNGSGSKASSGIAAYRWRQTGGIPVKLSDPTSATPTFQAAKYSGTDDDVLTFSLTVTDKNGLRSKAIEFVSVN